MAEKHLGLKPSSLSPNDEPITFDVVKDWLNQKLLDLSKMDAIGPAYPVDPESHEAYRKAGENANPLQPILDPINELISNLPDPQKEIFKMPNLDITNPTVTTVIEPLTISPKVLSDQEPSLTFKAVEQKRREDIVDDVRKRKVIYTLRPGERPVKSFGDLTFERNKQGNVVVIQESQNYPETRVNPDTYTRSEITAPKGDLFAQRIAQIEKAEGPQRIELMLGTLTELETKMAERSTALRKIAQTQSGLEAANAAIEVNKQQEIRTGFAQRRPGAISRERLDAMNSADRAILMTDNIHKSMLSSDPEYQKLDAWARHFQKIVNAVDITERLKAAKEEKKALATPSMIRNYRYAFDAELDPESDVINAIVTRRNDRKFMQTISAERETVLQNLVDNDKEIRLRAFKIISKAERVANGSTLENSTYLQQLSELVQNPDHFVKNKDIQSSEEYKLASARALTATTGEAGIEASRNLRLTATQLALSKRVVIDRQLFASNWPMVDPEMKSTLATLQATQPDGKVPASKFMEAWLPSNLSKEDFEARVQKLAQAIQISLQSAPESWIIPNQAAFTPAIMAQLESLLNERRMRWLSDRMFKAIYPIPAALGITPGMFSTGNK